MPSGATGTVRPDAAAVDAPPPGFRGLAWAAPTLEQLGTLMGGPIAERAEETDSTRPAWRSTTAGVTTSAEVVMPADVRGVSPGSPANNVTSAGSATRRARAGVDARPLYTAWAYLLCQAEIGMFCALGTGGDMVVRLAEEFAPTTSRTGCGSC